MSPAPGPSGSKDLQGEKVLKCVGGSADRDAVVHTPKDIFSPSGEGPEDEMKVDDGATKVVIMVWRSLSCR